MAITADFTANVRVGTGTLSVTFTDSSVGAITSRKWILGDGTVVDGNQTVVNHTYKDGKFDVTLVVQDGAEQDSETKTDYVIVDVLYAQPSLVIAQSWSQVDNEYWKLYIDDQRRLVYENESYIYRTVSAAVNVNKWTLIEFHPGRNVFYVGTYNSVRTRMDTYTSLNTSPDTPTTDVLEILPSTTMKIDEFKIWSRDVDLKDYYYETRGKAGNLDTTT
ncbi:MAG: PKD domain-containing protein [Candidatus Altiarchaeales archaeon]|nr:PKD domain-containing protein [Candidatus Altiarchaeales archaeon]